MKAKEMLMFDFSYLKWFMNTDLFSFFFFLKLSDTLKPEGDLLVMYFV